MCFAEQFYGCKNVTLFLFQKGFALWWLRCWLASAEASYWCWHFKEKRLAMVQVSTSADSLSQEKEDKTCATPKQPVVGVSTGEGWQLGEDRGQLIYFDLNLQKRTNSRWMHTSEGLCTDFWVCCFSYRAQSQDWATPSCNYGSHCQYKLMAQTAESGDQQIHAEYSTAGKHVKPLKSLRVTQMTKPNIY